MFIAFSSAHRNFPDYFCTVEHFPEALQKHQGCHFGSLFTALAYWLTIKPSTLVLSEAFSTTISVALFFLKFYYVVGPLSLIILYITLYSLKWSPLPFTLVDCAAVELYCLERYTLN